MFGYVKTDFPNLYIKDLTLYKAMYCGLCKGIGKCSGNTGRFALSYDLAFLSAFVHNVTGNDVNVCKQHCVLHRIRKVPVAVPDNLTERIGALNVILGHYKIKDDIEDENRGKLKNLFLLSAYKKAKKFEPKLDEIVKSEYSALSKIEKQKSDSIDMVSDPFGNMLKSISRELLGEFATEETDALCYNFGKWIYLIDALDDFDKDKKRKGFNVFNNIYKEIPDKKTLLKEKSEDLKGVFGAVLYSVAENHCKIKYLFNHDLIDNILLRGLPEQTKNILENKKCTKTIKY